MTNREISSTLAQGPIADRLGRPLRDLRISVTDRCNFRCVYCMPKEVFGKDYQFLEHKELLTFEEIARLARIFTPRRTRTRQATAGQGTISEVKEQIDHVPLAPSAGAGWFEFRPLTAGEKKEFENPLAAKGKLKPRLYPRSPTTAS